MTKGGVVDLGSGDVHIRVEGLSKTVRALAKAGADAQDMKDLMHTLGSLVVHAATPPTVSGALDGSMRAGRGKTKAVIRAGGARVPYAGVVHYGWPARGIRAQPFLTDALTSQRAKLIAALDAGLGDILRKNNL